MNTQLRVFNILATVIAVSAGLVVLAAYFVRLDVLVALRLALVSFVSLLAAWAVLAGALNLLIVHTRKFAGQAPGGLYSLFVVVGFLGVIVGNLVVPFVSPSAGGMAGDLNRGLLTYAISAGGAALAALIAFFLVYAAYRLLRLKRGGPPSLMLLVFVITVVLALIALAPWPAGAPNPTVLEGTTLHDVLITITQLPAIGGARGLLLGIALGAVATGLRLLLGLDRPYGD
jgi:hypothetical protein